MYVWILLAMVVITFAAFLFGLFGARRIGELRFIPYLTGAAFLEDIIGIYFSVFHGESRQGMHITNVANNCYEIIEFILLLCFLIRAIQSPKRRKIARMLGSGFVLVVVASWIHKPESFFLYLDTYFYVLGSLCLIVACLFYFYELIHIPRFIELKNFPSFWVATGILFFNTCSIPLFLLLKQIAAKGLAYLQVTYSLNYILYSITFLLFIRATLCKNRPDL